MVFGSVSLLQHPFPDVWRTVQDRDPCRLTRVEKTNTFDIHEIEFLQIQGYSWPATLDLGLQLVKVLRAKLSAQTNPRLALTRNPFDLQRHKLIRSAVERMQQSGHSQFIERKEFDGLQWW